VRARPLPGRKAPPLPATALTTARLVLEPLRVDHAGEMFAVLDDAALHRFVGGRPVGEAELRARYARQVAGRSPDGRQRWLNWIVRRSADGVALGFVQATVSDADDGRPPTAELAWTIGVAFQRRGYAQEAGLAMLGWLRSQGVGQFVAHIHPEHTASMTVARALDLRPTAIVVDGEVRWESAVMADATISPSE
jgi:RimJ/RimL family protein N-acetyltransferase